MENFLENPTVKTIFSRKSVRKFKDIPVEKETLLNLVKAGMAAPTAVNKQPWAFIIVDDRKTLNLLADKLPYAKMLFSATAAIVVCGLPKESLEEKPIDYAIIDSSAAAENILLAAEAIGLGAVWTAVYPRIDRIDIVREILFVPEDVLPFCVIPIGWPAGEEVPKDKYKPEKIHWNNW